MNAFNKMMGDIFNNDDFLEQCVINGILYDCICTNVENGITFTDVGTENEENFTLDLKMPVPEMIKVNDIVKFKEKQYKISNIVQDSAFSSLKLYLIALSKGIGQ